MTRPSDAIDRFLTASEEDRMRMVRAGEGRAELCAYLGEPAYAEYEGLSRRLDEHHLAAATPPNLVFVPGVMGSQLQSETKGGVWWIDVRTRDHLNDLALSPDGRTDADPENQIEPFNTDPEYIAFRSAALRRDDLGHRVFPYDWRKALRESARGLHDLVLRLQEENGRRPVHLVGHSMGGLVIRTALIEHDDLWKKVGRIVFIGTPHYGSPAIAGYLKNHLWGFNLLALLGLFLSRATFRSMWGVLSMLPAPRGVYPGTRPSDDPPWSPDDGGDYVHPCANFDMYRAESWNLDLSGEDTDHLQRVLDGAREFHRWLYEGHLALMQEQRDRMAVIAGVGYKTLFRLAYERRFWGLWEATRKVTEPIPGDVHRDGDGRVPLASASLENVPISYVCGVHGGLANLPIVYNAVFRYLSGEEMALPTTPGEACSEHLGADATESEAPNLDGSGRAVPFSDDPGVWDLAPPDPQQLEALNAKLEREQLPEFTRVRIL